MNLYVIKVDIDTYFKKDQKVKGLDTYTRTKGINNAYIFNDKLLAIQMLDKFAPSNPHAVVVELDLTEAEIVHHRFNKDAPDRDVCTNHCCFYHGCKYGKEDCVVETGKKVQSYPCESCQRPWL